MKKIIAAIFISLICLYIYGDPPTYSDVTYIFMIKDPYPSKIVLICNHDKAFFLRNYIDSDITYWYAIHFIESVSNTRNIYNQLSKTTGTANSCLYDIGRNTSNSIYQDVFGDLE